MPTSSAAAAAPTRSAWLARMARAPAPAPARREWAIFFIPPWWRCPAARSVANWQGMDALFGLMLRKVTPHNARHEPADLHARLPRHGADAAGRAPASLGGEHRQCRH